MLAKNKLIYKRSQEYIKEAVMPLIAAGFCIVSVKTNTMASASLILVPVAVNPFLRTFVYNFLNEKAEKYKELQKIMGLKSLSYIVSWLITNYLKGIVVGIFYLAPCIIFGVYTEHLGWLILLYFMYLFAALHESYMFTTFFSKPKMGSELTTLIQLLSTFVQFLVFIEYVAETKWVIYLLCLLPQFAVSIGILSSGWEEQQYLYPINFSLQEAILMLLIDLVIYFVAYLYFDQVFPNEYGTQKSWLFPIKYFFKSKKQDNNFILQESSELQQPLTQQPDTQNDNDFEQPKIRDKSLNLEKMQQDTSSALYHEPFLNINNLQKTVELKKLSKNFGQLQAVNQISLSLYQGQIFCLLGHNGAGKTTTISLLTGLLPKNNGKVKIYGKDLDEDLDEIRQNIGICMQKDVLYDLLTVEEHLKFICQIKGMSEGFIQQELKVIVEKCNLQTELAKYAKNLSGGNKRKLSLAMALIGSQVVFLDEPSSGLDPNSRRMVWQILKQVKAEQRTIVLTTHHLEEAEELAERIGIMAKGKLLTVGSSDFIKKKFGVGYHLYVYVRENNNNNGSINEKANDQQEININKNDNPIEDNNISQQKREWIIQCIMEHVHGARYNPQSPNNCVICTLPLNQRENFIELFKVLEQDNSIYINLEQNTLEDAFINIGMDEEKFLNPNNISQNQEKFTDFSDIPVPICLSDPPQYVFWLQFTAIFLRKFYCVLRTLQLFVSFFMPLIFQSAWLFVDWAAFNKYTDKDSEAIRLFWIAYFLVLSYCMCTSSFCGFLVNERETRMKYALNVMGCRTLPYWIGTFTFDYIMFLATLILFFVLGFSLNLSVIYDYFGPMVYVLISFGFTLIAWGHLTSFMFQQAQSAYKYIVWINFFFCFLIPLAFSFIKSEFVYYLITCIFPFTSLLNAFLAIIDYNYQNNSQSTFIKNPYTFVIIFFAQAIVYQALTFWLESRRYNLTQNSQFQEIQNYRQSEQQTEIDQDVIQEEQRVSNPGCQDAVKVQNLYKKYGNGFLAIKNNTFGVSKGEIFGLLGPNGAGKSTTFNILTSLIPKTSGFVKMKNIEVNKGIMDIYQNVGICAQFDTIYEPLTVMEHFLLMGRMKGLSGLKLEQSINYYIRVMQLNDYVNSKAGLLSGGNKRKLCVSLALIGGCDLQFFDEPSSGLDPIARRFLWNTLNQSLKLRQSAIVLTTHSMHEAESLCQKIGILINGRFKCIGSPQHLKKKFGDGYNITVKSDQKDIVTQLILQKFPQAKQFQEFQEQGVNQILIKIPYQDFSYYTTFSYLQNELLQKNIIQDFSITQSSLEQIFIYFSSFQKVLLENQNFKEPWYFLCIKCG